MKITGVRKNVSGSQSRIDSNFKNAKDSGLFTSDFLAPTSQEGLPQRFFPYGLMESLSQGFFPYGLMGWFFSGVILDRFVLLGVYLRDPFMVSYILGFQDVQRFSSIRGGMILAFLPLTSYP